MCLEPAPGYHTSRRGEVQDAGERAGRLWCRFAWREVYISYEGDVSPCDHQNRPVVGNVFRDKWEDIWNGEEYQKLRSGLHSGTPQSYCASCAILAEFGLVGYQEAGYMFEDKYTDAGSS